MPFLRSHRIQPYSLNLGTAALVGGAPLMARASSADMTLLVLKADKVSATEVKCRFR